MLFVCTVTYTKTPYMTEMTISRSNKVLHTVEADDEEQARHKVEKHYQLKSDPYGDTYTVDDITFAVHIK